MNKILFFQEDQSRLENFTYQKGYGCWRKAIDAANRIRLPACTIYFSVDFDATEAQAKGAVTDFFRGPNDAKAVSSSIYQIGIYSARNTCNVIRSAGLAGNCYISNMSTGYSGNLGYLMPTDWCFDQYANGICLAGGRGFGIDKVIASGVDQAVLHRMETENDYWERHSLNFEEIAQAVDNAVPISKVIPEIKTLEAAYWACYPQKDIEESARDCVLAVLYYLWHKKYTAWDFNITLNKDNRFRDYVDNYHARLAEKLDQYIQEGDIFILKDNSSTADSYTGLFELHHLAAGISAYIELRDLPDLPNWPFSEIKPEWYAWAGGLASAFNEIHLLKKDPHYQNEITHARDRIGRMEVGEDKVQMNHCEIFGDADGYAIYTIVMDLLQNSADKRYILSTALELYYSDPADPSYCHYMKRFSHLLDHLPITYHSISSMTEMMYNYFVDDSQKILLKTKAKMENDNSEHLTAIHACCRAYAEVIMHYFEASKQ